MTLRGVAGAAEMPVLSKAHRQEAAAPHLIVFWRHQLGSLPVRETKDSLAMQNCRAVDVNFYFRPPRH